MIKPIFHFFKIHRKMILGNPAVVVQNMLGKTPESFNAVNVVFSLLVHHMFRMIHFVMLAKTFQGIVAPKGVRIVHRSFASFLSDDSHKVISRYAFHYPCVNPSAAPSREAKIFRLRKRTNKSCPCPIRCADNNAFIPFSLPQYLNFGY